MAIFTSFDDTTSTHSLLSLPLHHPLPSQLLIRYCPQLSSTISTTSSSCPSSLQDAYAFNCNAPLPFPSFSSISLFLGSVFGHHPKGSLELAPPFFALASLASNGRANIEKLRRSCNQSPLQVAWVTSLLSISALEESSQDLRFRVQRKVSSLLKREAASLSAAFTDNKELGGLASEDSGGLIKQGDTLMEGQDSAEGSLILTVAKPDTALQTSKHLFAGAMAAVVSRTVVAPLERLKLEYMVRGARSNVLEIIKLITATEGLRGFWRGNVVNLLRTAPFKSINFFCYDTYRKHLLEITGKEEVSNFERLVAGAAAGVTATLLCFPMDTIRTRMVAPGGEALGGVIDCFCHMLHTEGFFSLYKGLLPAVIAMAPSGAVFYGVYDILKSTYLQSPEGQAHRVRRLRDDGERRKSNSKIEGDLKEAAESLNRLELGPIRTLLYGAIAGICAETATYPFEVVRRQLQMQKAATRMGAFTVCQDIIREGGLGGLYSGLLPSSLQVLPSAALSYFVYEYMKILLKVP